MNNNIEQIIAAIKEYETIIIHRHVRPDLDALGSQAGLQQLIKQSFPTKQVYIVGEDEPSLSFLVKMDTIADDNYENALVIVCDTANTDRIDDQRYQKGKKLIKIDHHPNVDQYGDIQWVNTVASSTSEMIVNLYQAGKNLGLQLNATAARLLYAGIVGDTGRFLFQNTSSSTFQAAAELVGYSFDRQALYQGMYDMAPNIAKLQGFFLQNMTISSAGVSSMKLTKAMMEEYGVTSAESSQIVGTLGGITGINAWAMFVEHDDGIRVRLRSKGPTINQIAAKYNGGGHPLAAGATIQNWDEVESVLADLEEVCLAYRSSE